MDLNTLDGVLTRTKKADVAPFAVRQAKSIHLSFTDAERAFYDAVTAFCAERYVASGGNGFGAITYQRQVCSSIPAMRELLRTIAAEDDRETIDDGTSWYEDDSERRSLTPAEQELLDNAMTAAHAVGDVDAKYRCFEELIVNLIDDQRVERIMVFSFFRRTIRYLERRLGSRYRVGVIMGGMSLEERAEVVDSFKKGEIQILLASEVGGEGLDFQFCNVLVNYDLPWNPMRVEQRIGRLDRYGQRHEKILIYNLLVEDTVESRIFGRLFERIELFNAAIGDLEAILGEAVSELTKDAMDLRLTAEQQSAKAEKLAQQLIHKKQIEGQLAQGKDALLSNEQYLLDRFGALQRGRAYLTADELANFCTEALERHFPRTRITRSGSRWWLRPDSKFAEYVRREIYGAGADGHLHHVSHVLRPLVRLRSAAEAEQAIGITFEADEGFDDRQLELMSPQHPYVQALVRRSQDESLNRLSVARLRVAASADLDVGSHALVLYKIQSTGLRPLRRLEAVAIPLGRGSPVRMPAEWLGQFLEAMTDAEQRDRPASGSALDRALESGDQLLVDSVQSERNEIEGRQNDLVQLRLASLQFAFEQKRNRLQHAISTVANAAIQRLRRGELANATARHEAQVAALKAQNKIAVTYDRVAVALLDVV
ncbi:MAG: helicase-related protein [Gemmatimonadota bacterium]